MESRNSRRRRTVSRAVDTRDALRIFGRKGPDRWRRPPDRISQSRQKAYERVLGAHAQRAAPKMPGEAVDVEDGGAGAVSPKSKPAARHDHDAVAFPDLEDDKDAESRADPDAQTTVTDLLDFTDYLPSDMVRSLTLVGKLD